MTKGYTKYDETEKEFYFFLGLLSTRFSIVEYNILKLLGGLISSDFVLTNTLLERNSLAQNIEYLKKINKIREFEVQAMSNLIQQITNIKRKRNLFIHGLWTQPIQKENDIIIKCNDPKLDYSERTEDGSLISKTWTSLTEYEFRLSYLKKLATNLSDIILAQENLIERLEDHEFE